LNISKKQSNRIELDFYSSAKALYGLQITDSFVNQTTERLFGFGDQLRYTDEFETSC